MRNTIHTRVYHWDRYICMASSSLLASSVLIHLCLPFSLEGSSSFSSDSNPAVDREEPFPADK